MNIKSREAELVMKRWGDFWVDQQGQHFFVKGGWKSNPRPSYNRYVLVFSWGELDRMSIEEFEEEFAKGALKEMFGHA